MKEINELLKDIQTFSNRMEFCDDFSAIQTILSRADESIVRFDSIVFQGGNEENITDIVSKLSQYLQSKGYLDENNVPSENFDGELRKITFFLCLNTDVSFKFDLNADENVCHVLNTIPQLSKCLFMNFVQILNLHKYFYEILSFSPLWFSVQYINEAIVSLKFAKPYEILAQIEGMVKSVYFSIVRSDVNHKKSEHRDQFIEQQILLTKLYDYTMEMQRHFHTPDANKFEKFSKTRLHKYAGYALKNLLEIILHCFDLYLSKNELKVDGIGRFYELMGETIVKREKNVSYSENSDHILTQLNLSLLNTLQNNVMEITLEHFLIWAELDVFEDDNRMTLQQAVGESAYKLAEMIRENKCFDHDVVKQLSSIAIKPKSKEDRARSLTLGELMFKLEKPTDRHIYFDEFIRREESVFGNIECLSSMLDNIDLISVDHLTKLITFDNQEQITEESDSDDYDEERLKIKEIILKSLEYLKVDEICKLISFVIENFGQDFCKYQDTNLNGQIIEFTNKLTNNQYRQDENPQFINFVFQNPALFFKKLLRNCYETGFNNTNFVSEIVKLIDRTKDVSFTFINDEIHEILRGNLEILNYPSLIDLMLRLYEIDFFDRNEFVDSELLQVATESFASNRLGKLYGILSLIEKIWKADTGFIQNNVIVKLLRHLGDMATKLRYDVTKLEVAQDVDKIQILECILRIIPGLVTKLTKINNKNSIAEIRAHTDSYELMTKYYFHGLYEKNKQEFAPYIYDGMLEQASTKPQIRLFLSKTFLQCTTEEAIQLTKDPLLLPNIADAVLIITVLLSEQPNHFECLKNCLSNFLIALDRCILPAKTTDDERSKLVKGLTNVTNKLPAASREPLLASMTHGLSTIIFTIQSGNPSVDVSAVDKLLNI